MAKQAWEKHFENLILEYPNEAVVRALSQNRKKFDMSDCTLVDLGCGTGRHTITALKMGYKVIAVDFVEHCIEVTKKRVNDLGYGSKVKYIHNENTELDIADESVDMVLGWGVCFYNKRSSIEVMLKSIHRILKKNGICFVDFRTQNDSIYLKGKQFAIEKDTILMQSELDLGLSLEGTHMYIPSYDELREMMKLCGFQIENIELYEFTEKNQEEKNSWWHITLVKK